ncbi:hypothetical protein MMG00_12910 [Ignatzschineria rhizosphaerae]|uniref:Uncharacterized protein n=1 Tax=Ignatzschineria rhizosphaerae TaxID=2923279 RepID=A0ABY3WY10_9GAMM|nr:hypothetical protein [Ignatzschineria rhizosphaerae]UNM95502.1 hypothetical protein MMG00_09745 [Ignatzschineria rhizosphaerae]UNM96082.1 hypothetical protein MMG00_12910 [Ignatzschineria rhizosphaerae]
MTIVNRTIEANGFETLDGCLYRNEISTALLEAVLTHEKNRHLATLPTTLPVRTKIYVPHNRVQKKEIKQLWD